MDQPHAVLAGRNFTHLPAAPASSTCISFPEVVYCPLNITIYNCGVYGGAGGMKEEPRGDDDSLFPYTTKSYV